MERSGNTKMDRTFSLLFVVAVVFSILWLVIMVAALGYKCAEVLVENTDRVQKNESLRVEFKTPVYLILDQRIVAAHGHTYAQSQAEYDALRELVCAKNSTGNATMTRYGMCALPALPAVSSMEKFEPLTKTHISTWDQYLLVNYKQQWFAGEQMPGNVIRWYWVSREIEEELTKFQTTIRVESLFTEFVKIPFSSIPSKASRLTKYSLQWKPIPMCGAPAPSDMTATNLFTITNELYRDGWMALCKYKEGEYWRLLSTKPHYNIFLVRMSSGVGYFEILPENKTLTNLLPNDNLNIYEAKPTIL